MSDGDERVPGDGGYPQVGVHPIETESYAIMASRVDLSSWPEGARAVVARMVHATADETFATSARVGHQAVEAVVRALQGGAPVICDARMVVAGIPGVARATSVSCYLDRVTLREAVTKEQDPRATRSAAAIDVAAGEHGAGAIWVIGNAPTALARLVDLCRAGSVTPAAVIGLPVGYVGAAEAKQALWDSDLRPIAITNEGPRGGSAVAAAALNALARIAWVTPPA